MFPKNNLLNVLFFLNIFFFFHIRRSVCAKRRAIIFSSLAHHPAQEKKNVDFNEIHVLFTLEKYLFFYFYMGPLSQMNVFLTLKLLWTASEIKLFFYIFFSVLLSRLSSFYYYFIRSFSFLLLKKKVIELTRSSKHTKSEGTYICI